MAVRHRAGVWTLAALVPGCAAAARPPAPAPASPPPPSIELPILPAAGQPAELEVEVGCDDADLRVVVAQLAWHAERAQRAAQRIDLTVFREGFERGWFASVPADREGRAIPAPELLRMGRDPGRPFEVNARPRYDVDANRAVVELRGPEPGVLYRFRLLTRTAHGWRPDGVASVQAPVCIAEAAGRER